MEKECTPDWLQLAAPAWHNVFGLLHPKDLVSLIRACKQFRHLADASLVWKKQATAWGSLADIRLGGYQSCKDMILDDNRRAAVLVLPLPGAVCNYRYRRNCYFFQCRLLQLQWWRSCNILRLYLDARGEYDLRHPMASTLAVVQLHPEQAQKAQRHRGNSRTAAADSISSPGGAEFSTDSAGVRWHKTVRTFRPDGCTMFVQKQGHYKGVLTWSSDKCSEVLGLLFPASGQQHVSVKPPAQQHMHQQRGRRSQAWEDWADWQLQHNNGSAQCPHTNGAVGQAQGILQSDAADGYGHPHWWSPVWHALAGAGRHGQPFHIKRGDGVHSAGCDVSNVAGSSSSSHEQSIGRCGLVFCYANDLSLYPDRAKDFGHYPDYTTALLAAGPDTAAETNRSPATCVAGPSAAALAAASTDSTLLGRHQTSSSSTTRGVCSSSPTFTAAPAATSSCSDAITDPAAAASLDVQRGSLNIAMQPVAFPVRLHDVNEPHWVASWLQLQGATVQQRRLTDHWLSTESEESEKQRWSDLPEQVKQRGAEWWQ